MVAIRCQESFFITLIIRMGHLGANSWHQLSSSIAICQQLSTTIGSLVLHAQHPSHSPRHDFTWMFSCSGQVADRELDGGWEKWCWRASMQLAAGGAIPRTVGHCVIGGGWGNRGGYGGQCTIGRGLGNCGGCGMQLAAGG